MTPLTVLGAGPAGLAVAWYAHRQGRSVVVYEKAAGVGGMVRTLSHRGHRFDTGAHRFHHRDAGATRLLETELGLSLHPVSSPSRIHDRGRTYAFPPRPLEMLTSEGLAGIAPLAVDQVRARLHRGPIRTFEDHALRRYGKRLSRRFLLPYTEKLWGLPARQLSSRVATGRLSGLTATALLLEILRPSTQTPRHLDGAFLYPRGGIGDITRALADALPPGSIRTNRAVHRLQVRGGRVVEIHFSRGSSVPVTGPVVSTLPLPHLARALESALPPSLGPDVGELRYRSLRLVFLALDQPRVGSEATLYFPDRRLCFTRVSEPRNRSAALAPPGETGLLAEVPCFAGDSLDRLPDGVLRDRVVRDLAGVGLLDSARIRSWTTLRLPHAYPVQDLRAERRARRLREACRQRAGIRVLGRTGTFVYGHVHEQMAEARDRWYRDLAHAAS